MSNEKRNVQVPKLEGRCAIVTGSTSGIGLAIAKCLAREGCSLVLNGSRDESNASSLVAEIANEYGVKVVYCQADFSNPELAAKKIVEKCVQVFGTVDILGKRRQFALPYIRSVVNNAGIQHVCPVDEFPTDMWNTLMNINLNGPFHCIKQCLPYMKKNKDKWGRIVNISSVHGVVASINKSAYVAAKHGLNGLTKVVALETAADTKITCNAICPGFVITPLLQQQIDARAKAKNISIEEASQDLVGEKQPTKRFTTSEQIGDMVAFLCSESASNITGSVQLMDGGWSTQ